MILTSSSVKRAKQQRGTDTSKNGVQKFKRKSGLSATENLVPTLNIFLLLKVCNEVRGKNMAQQEKSLTKITVNTLKDSL